MLKLQLHRLPFGYTLRRLSLFDILGVFRLGRLCFPDGSFNHKRFLKAYRKGRDTCFVIRTKGLVVGFIIAFMREDGGYISYMAIASENRRLGLGQAMVETVHRIFAASGAPRVTLHVRTTRAPAIALYQKLGYVIEATREHYYPNGESAYVMHLTFIPKD